MSKPYLALYNASQAAGWSFLLYQTVVHLVTTGPAGLYPATRLTLQVFQTGAQRGGAYCNRLSW